MSSSLSNRLSHITSHFSNRARNGLPKVVLTRELGPDIMPLFDSGHGRYDLHIWEQDSACDRQWLLQTVKDAVALIVLVTDKIDAEVLDAAGSQLKVVSTMSVGYEHIDVKELARRNIKLGYTPDVLTDAVADVAVMLALMAGRLGRRAIEFVTEGNWPDYSWAPFSFCGAQLSISGRDTSRTAGFIGFGRISLATLARLIPFGITSVLYFSNPSSPPNAQRDASLLASLSSSPNAKLSSLRRAETLVEVARESDVLFVLAPGGEETRGLVNEQLLREMKKTAVLVNASRGSVVDSEALATALREGWIWGAGLDVVEGEPNVGADHPLVREPRCVVLPHIGSATLQTRLDMAALAVKNALLGIDGYKMPAEVELQKR